MRSPLSVLTQSDSTRFSPANIATDVASVQGQYFPFFYPSPGHVPVRMLYK